MALAMQPTRSSLSKATPFVTKDGSVIRELMHPGQHAARHQSLAEATLPPGGATALHLHKVTEEVYHFTAGSGSMRLGEESFAVAAGDTVVIAPGVPHGLTSGPEAELVLLCACAPAYAHEDTFLLEGDDVFEARLRAWLAASGVVAEHRVFEASCHSVAEAAAAVGAPVEDFIKSVCLVLPDGRLAVAVVKGEDKVDRARVAAAWGLSGAPRLARPMEMLARTLFPAGGTPPFGFDALFLVDERVLERGEVWGGGGSSRSLVRVAPEALRKANGGRVARVRA